MTHSDFRQVTACRLCDATELEQVLDLGQTPLANELDGTELFPLIVNRCGGCGHHQLSIAVSPARLWGPSYPYQSGTSPVFRAHLEKLADEVAALKPGGRVLEIAGNDGTLCKMLYDRGLFTFNVDPSATEDIPGVQIRASWPDPEVLGILMGMERSDAGSFDIILALNVFAHVDDLHSFTAAVKEALAPDGVFIVEVGYLVEQADREQFDTFYLEHLSYHTLAPLFPFFNRHGLRIDEWATNDSQGGSLRLYLSHMRPGEAQGSSQDLHPQAMLWLRKAIDSRAAALKTALEKLFYRGEMVCIYGAPAKLTTLLYATGLDKMPFNCVFDDCDRKIGRTTPGMHLPIVSSSELLARNPDTLLVSSWNYFDDIEKKVRAMGYKGGLINPMGDR